MPAITASDGIQPSPPQPRSPEQEKLLPLMAHFSSANLSCEDLARPETPWLPQRNEPGDVSISLAEEEARLTRDEENPSSSLPRRLACAALSLLGVAAVGSLAYYRFARHDGESVPGALVPGADNETLPDMPLPAYLAAAPETTTRKQCLYPSRWRVGVSEKGPCPDEIQEIVEKQEKERQEKARIKAEREKKKAEEVARQKAEEDARRKAEDANKEKRCLFTSNWPGGGGDTYGPCPESRPPVQSNKKKVEEEARKKAEEDARKKAEEDARKKAEVAGNKEEKRCLFRSRWPGGSDTYGPCPESRKPVQSNKVKNKPKTTTTTTTTEKPPAEKIKYYMPVVQPAVCREFSTLQRCERVHPNYPRKDRLILQYNDKNCYCPPPEKKKSWYEIVYIAAPGTNTTHTTTPAPTTPQPSSILYYQSKNEPAVCQEKAVQERCEKMHASHPGVNRLLLPVRDSTCYCPPPEARKSEYTLLYVEDEESARTTTPKTTSTTTPVPTTAARPTKKPFYTKKNQPAICKDINLLARCERVLANYPAATQQVLKSGSNDCYCPPPVKKRNQYDVIYLDEQVNQKSQAVTEPAAKGEISTNATRPAPEKRGKNLIYLRLPDEDYDKLGRRPVASLIPEPKNDVKIEKMFDLECIEARNNLGWSNIVRVIGETLEAPLTKISEEFAVIRAHNEGRGCPPAEELEYMQAITSRIDQVLSTLLQFLPHSQPLRIAQNIIGPGMQILANDLDGIETPGSQLLNFVQQITSLAKDMLPTLATENKLSLYAKPEQKAIGTAPDKSTFTERFIFRDRKNFISVGGKEYEIRSQADDKPYIIDEDGRLSYVQYNKDVGQWGFIEQDGNLLYADKNRDLADIYGLALSELPADYRAEIDYTDDFVTITSAGKAPVTGVFVGNAFVPATLQKERVPHFALTSTPQLAEIKSLKKTPAGWVFDAPSANINDYLRMLFDSHPTGIQLTRDTKIAPVDDITHLSKGIPTGNYIKYNERYYKADLEPQGDGGDDLFELADFAQAKVKLENDRWVLDNEENMLFPLRTIPVRELLPDDKRFFIEAGALNFLLHHARTVETTPYSRFGPGIYSDKQGVFFFAVQKSKFKVAYHSGREIEIEHDPQLGQKKDITLWSDGETWYRIRDTEEDPPVEYQESTLCRSKRFPPGAGNCPPIMIEKDLHAKLQKHIFRKSTTNSPPSSEGLTEVDSFDIPFLYRDKRTGKYYFLYEDHYFDAKIIEPDDKNNPTGLHGLSLSGKGTFVNSNPLIENIVTSKENDRIVIKTMPAYIAEKLNIDKNIAANYIRKRAWRDINEMSMIEEAASNAGLPDEAYVELQPDRSAPPQPQKVFNDIWPVAKPHLYPQRIVADNGYFFRIFPLSSHVDTYGAYERNAIQLCTDQIQNVQGKVLPVVIDGLSHDAPGAALSEDYIAEVLQSSDRRLNNDVMASLRNRLKKIESALQELQDENNILLTTVLHNKATDTEPEREMSLLLDEEKSSGVASFIPEKSNYLFINTDKASDIDYMSVLLYGVSQSKEIATPLTGIARENGIYLTINDAINALATKLEQRALTGEEFARLSKISQTYLEKVPAYKNIHIFELLDQRKLGYMLQFDPGYRAHVLLNSSEYLTLLTQDLYHRLSVKNAEGVPSRLDRWMKKYGEQRAFILFKEKQLTRGDLTAAPVKESIFKSADFDGEQYLNEALSVTEIKNNLATPNRNSDAVSPYVANFMWKKGFSNIRHRAMALFTSIDDGTPATHFAVTGERDGKEYVFDLAAGEFAERYDALEGPVILPEQRWAQKYALLSENLLVKYADFTSLDAAQQRFNQYNQYLYWGPEIKIPDARVLRSPEWYFPQTAAPDSPALPGMDRISRLGYTNPVREAARRSQLSVQTSGTSWNYAVKMLENADLLTQGAAAELRAEILRAVDFRRTKARTPGSLDDLLVNPRSIMNSQQILRIKAGELLAFMAAEPAQPGKGMHPVHVMVSTGNGRFAGINNSFINTAFDDGKRILTAEQLGDFANGRFRRRGKNAETELYLMAGFPKEIQIKNNPGLWTLAQRTSAIREEGKYIAGLTAAYLRVAGELAAEQSIALSEALLPLLDTKDGAVRSTRSVQDLLYHPERVYSKSDLATLPKGQLVIFGKTTSSYMASHVMYSLGYGEFLMVDPTHLDPQITSANMRVESSQFPDEIFKNHKVYAGEISLENLRLTALLGPDSMFAVKNNIVEVTLHGAIANGAFLDGPELADVISGLALREKTPVDWTKVNQIELNSCYSALGRLPLGKVVAYLLQKKVTAWPRLYSKRAHDNPDVSTHGKVFLPRDVTPAELQLVKKQATRNYYFWSHLLHGWVYRTLDRLRKKRDVAEMDNMFENVFGLVNGNITVDSFFEKLPEYKKQINTTPELFAKIVADPVDDEEEFAERCMDVFSLSRYSEGLVNEYLSQLD